MNKQMLLKAIRIHASITNVESEAFLKSFIKVIKSSAQKEEEVNIAGFGKFKIVKYKGRMLKLLDGTKVYVCDRNLIKFVPFKAFKEIILT